MIQMLFNTLNSHSYSASLILLNSVQTVLSLWTVWFAHKDSNIGSQKVIWHSIPANSNFVSVVTIYYFQVMSSDSISTDPFILLLYFSIYSVNWSSMTYWWGDLYFFFICEQIHISVKSSSSVIKYYSQSHLYWTWK